MLHAAGGSYVVFVQGVGNLYLAAGICLPHQSLGQLAASSEGKLRLGKHCLRARRGRDRDGQWRGTERSVLSPCAVLWFTCQPRDRPSTSNRNCWSQIKDNSVSTRAEFVVTREWCAFGRRETCVCRPHRHLAQGHTKQGWLSRLLHFIPPYSK